MIFLCLFLSSSLHPFSHSFRTKYASLLGRDFKDDEGLPALVKELLTVYSPSSFIPFPRSSSHSLPLISSISFFFSILPLLFPSLNWRKEWESSCALRRRQYRLTITLIRFILLALYSFSPPSLFFSLPLFPFDLFSVVLLFSHVSGRPLHHLGRWS